MIGGGVERVVSDAANALLVPVLVLALLSLALALVEAGRVIVELSRRRRRGLHRLDRAAAQARRGVRDGDVASARAALRGVSGSARVAATAELLLPETDVAEREVGPAPGEARRAKLLADHDYGSLRALERTRVLVRAGPALGLMGTLIPLSPALDALSRGDVGRLAQDLRVAFSVTVLGLLVGALAFAVSLVRDRLYGQDLSDLEYLAAALHGTDASADGPSAGRPAAASPAVPSPAVTPGVIRDAPLPSAAPRDGR